MRWGEEVELLQEEMRRVLNFLEWHAQWWVERAGNRGKVDDLGLREGLPAYALRQASIRIKLREKFATLWRPVDLWVKAGQVLDLQEESHLKVDDEGLSEMKVASI